MKNNLVFLATTNRLHINTIGLSDRDGIAENYREDSNLGNSSLIKSLVSQKRIVKTEIKFVNTTEYFSSFLRDLKGIAFRCDTHGIDAFILARVPKDI